MSRSSAGSIAAKVRKIESQARRLDERAGLLDVRAENVAQRGVHQVRPRVIALDVLAPRAVGIFRDEISHDKFFLRQNAVRDQSRDGIVRAPHVGNLDRVFIVPKRPDVGNLSARFRVKHGAIEDNFAFRARRQVRSRAPSFVTMASMRRFFAIVSK